MKHRGIKNSILREMGIHVALRREMRQMCSTKSPSMLRNSSLDSQQSFSWNAFMEELQERAPTLLQILKEASKKKIKKKSKKHYAIDDNTVVSMCAACCCVIDTGE